GSGHRSGDGRLPGACGADASSLNSPKRPSAHAVAAGGGVAGTGRGAEAQAFLCLGMKIVTEISAAMAIRALKASPTMPASRTARLSWRPENSTTAPTISSPVVASAVKMAADAATPKAAPKDEAIL